MYENALCIELRKLGLDGKQQVPIQVFYEGALVGEYVADLLVEGRIIIEVKAVRVLTREHEVQLVNYLVATSTEVGLLINFGPSVEIKRKYRTYHQAGSQPRVAVRR